MKSWSISAHDRTVWWPSPPLTASRKRARSLRRRGSNPGSAARMTSYSSAPSNRWCCGPLVAQSKVTSARCCCQPARSSATVRVNGSATSPQTVKDAVPVEEVGAVRDAALGRLISFPSSRRSVPPNVIPDRRFGEPHLPPRRHLLMGIQEGTTKVCLAFSGPSSESAADCSRSRPVPALAPVQVLRYAGVRPAAPPAGPSRARPGHGSPASP